MTKYYPWIVLAIVSIVTIALRFLPFVFFTHRKTPKIVEKLGASLPHAIMGMLVVYCLKSVNIKSVSGFLPELIATVTVAVLYIWKRNTLLSIIVGTILYMVLVQSIF